MNVVIYHKNCTDGIASREVARRYFQDKASYIPMHYGDPLPSILTEQNKRLRDVCLYVLDFSFPREVILELKGKLKQLVVLDHHIGAQKALEDIEGCYFNQNRSGATMTWEYFFPHRPLPRILQYVEDYDLWRFALTNSRIINRAIKFHQDSIGFWQRYMHSNDTLEALVGEGKVLQALAEKQIRRAARQARLMVYDGHQIALTNATNNISELGELLVNTLPIDYSMSYFIRSDAKVVLSFRSKGGFDVSLIAEKLGGSGHKNASGALVDLAFLTALYAQNETEEPEEALSESTAV